MLAKKTLSASLLLSFIFSFSQSFNIKGKVTDNQSKALEYAIVSVLNPDTFDEVSGSVTDANGLFSVDVPAGKYLLNIESFTGNSIEQEINVTKNENLGTFKINETSVVTLEGATLSGASTPVYRMELDKKVYDVSKDPMTKGRSLSEALENVPSVQVDGEGNVSLRGNENVRILIDGKPSALIGISDPAQALQSLPADIVDRIEVVTNPSARYEAEGSAGIINIILKKGKLKGLNGSVNVSGGIPATASASVNLNYRTGKWNIFTNFGYRYSNWERKNSSKTTRFNSDGIPRYEEMNGESTRKNNGFNLMLGTEYYLTDKDTFTISGSYRKQGGDDDSDLNYLDFDADRNQTASSTRTQRQDSDGYDIEGNFNYKHEFNDKGHEFTVDVRSNYSEDTKDGSLREIGNLVDSSERTANFETRNNTTISADYVYPFGEKGKLEIGARGDITGMLTDFKVDSLANDGWVPKDKFFTRTDYMQNVYAAYVQFGQAFGKFSYFAGIRMENSDITVKSILDNSTVNKNYTDFFPSLFLNYEFENTDQLQLSYSRRIRRPRGWFLIPFSSYSDNRNLFMGNPSLNPQYTDSYEMSYVTKLGKLMVTPNIYYSITHDNIQRYQSINEDGAIVSRPINVGTDERYGGDLTFTYRPFRWWNMMGNVNLYGYKTRGQHTDTYTDIETGETTTQVTNFDGEGFSWFGRLSNTFNLPSKFSVQLSGMYRAGNKTAQSERKPMYGADLSVSKDLFNDNATITASVRDLFNTRSFRSTSFGENFFMESEFRWGVRSVNVSFTYRFNQSKRDQRKRQQQNQENGDFDMDSGGAL
ncbi:MAG: TonB-dependent receptor [Flavobacteriia bacterium]|nr:TonB-dependent receptor [Flavobacteriia bacterium]